MRYYLFSFLMMSKLFALPLGNPYEASLLTDGVFLKKACVTNPLLKAISFKYAYYGDFVFGHSLQASENHLHDDMEKFDRQTNALYLAVNFFERFDLFALYGKSRFFFETNALTFGGINGNRFALETSSGMSWSVGSRFTVCDTHFSKMGLVFQYFNAHPKIDRITLADSHSVYLDNSSVFAYREWQVGAGISIVLWRFSPYIGVKYSHASIDLGNVAITMDPQTIHLFALKSKKHFGIATGVSLIDSERMQLTLEARILDEKAVYVNRQMRF